MVTRNFMFGAQLKYFTKHILKGVWKGEGRGETDRERRGREREMGGGGGGRQTDSQAVVAD